jgi:1-acyl-sn-glycerol-3-phosphate acyltransferase
MTPRPAGWQPPPRDTIGGILATARVAGTMLAAMAKDLATHRVPTRSTTTAAGLAEVRERCRALLAAIGVEVEVRGSVPADGGFVFMWNQTSHLDHVLLPVAIPRPFHLTYNNEVRRFPIYGRYLAASDHFWLDRTDEQQWRAQLDIAARRIRVDGACVLVSPEGTRSWDGRILPMKRGAFLLARTAQRPIVCVTLSGARERMPRGRLGITPGRVTISLSPPIPIETPDLEARVVATFEGREQDTPSVNPG